MDLNHPIEDFLTDNMVQFLKELDAKTLKQLLIFFYGEGANGKSAFVNVLRKIKNCLTMPSSMFSKSSHEHHINRIKMMSPDLIIINDPQTHELDEYIKLDTLERILSLKIPIIILTNVMSMPDNLSYDDKILNNNQMARNDVIKIINFQNEYHHDNHPQYARFSQVHRKKALDMNDIDNDEAVKILTKVMKNNK